MGKITAPFNWHGQKVTNTWTTNKVSEGSKVTQVYGICFNENNEILVIKEPGKKWRLPGGTPEMSESIEETLERECREEANILIKEPQYLGHVRVDYPNNPNKEEGDLFYQVRYICLVSRELPPRKDPCTGKLWTRKFVPYPEIGNYIKWGKIGNAMFKDAFALYQEYNFTE